MQWPQRVCPIRTSTDAVRRITLKGGEAIAREVGQCGAVGQRCSPRRWAQEGSGERRKCHGAIPHVSYRAWSNADNAASRVNDVPGGDPGRVEQFGGRSRAGQPLDREMHEAKRRER